MSPLKDVYANLDELKRDLRAGRDYRIRVLRRASQVTILSPHGGYIDEGTSALARAVAADNYNLFDFQGLHAENSLRLHVTSTRFRDDNLLELLSKSTFALSVHGMDDPPDEAETIWLGGLNHELKQVVQDRLVDAGFKIDKNPPKYRGEHPKNVVNLTVNKGVQLELPLTLRKQMFRGGKTFKRDGRCPKTTPLFDRFVRAVRLALSQCSGSH